jgi:hypothetical protein
LVLNVDVAIHVAKAVMAVSGAAVSAAIAYKTIKKTLRSIKSDRREHELRELRIARDETKIMAAMASDLAKLLGFKNLSDLHSRTGDPGLTVKLLLAHYRRISDLAEYVQERKVELPVNAPLVTHDSKL